jgi:branched-chain amino acid transport system permease protein
MTAPSPRVATRFRVQRATRTSRATVVLGVGLLLGLATLPAWGESSTMRLLIQFFALLAMGQMWNLLAGYGGLVSIGQQAFVGIGAYGLFLFTELAGLPVLAAIACMAGATVVIASVTSLFAFRLRGGYFAVGTWVIAEVFRIIVSNVQQLGAGTGVTVQSLVRMPAADRLALTYWLALGVGFGSIVLVTLVMRSRLGLGLAAIRDSEVAASGLGVNVQLTKRIVYVIASVGCAVAGSVLYVQLLRIQPVAAFSVDWTVKMIFIVVIGGLGRIEGPIVGAIIFIAMRETLADCCAAFPSAYLVALGLLMIVIVVLAPRGLWGLLTSRWSIALFAIRRRLVRLDGPS